MYPHDRSARQGEAEAEHELLLVQVREANSQLVLAGLDARRRAAELEAALASIADGVVVYGSGGEIIRLNRVAEEILGMSPEEQMPPPEAQVGRLRVETEDGELFDPDETPAQRALRGETVRGLVMVLHHPDGRAIWVSASAAPIMMADGELLGAVATFTDVTELHQLQQQLERLLETEQEARSAAERAVRVRDEFISIAAHELKTPVTSISGFAQTIIRQFNKTGQIDPARLTRGLEIISQQTKKLTRLTEQLLNVSRLEAGKLTLSREETDLYSVVESVVASFINFHPERVLKLRGNGVIPASVDSLRLEQVFTNLLDNAIKFSPASLPVEVDVETDEAGCWATVSVRDYGIGVAQDQREKIFGRFHKAHAEPHYGGMGIGLYVSRQLVELHGGSITLEHPKGGGSKFVVRLPLHCP